MSEDIKQTENQSSQEGIMDKQANEEYTDMSKRDKEIQSSIWALILLVAEMALAFRGLRDRLQAKEVLTPEDQQMIDEVIGNEEPLRQAYNHIEKAFRAKFDRCLFAMENPEEVERLVNEQRAAQQAATSQFKSTVGGEVIDLGAAENTTPEVKTEDQKPKFIDLSQGENK